MSARLPLRFVVDALESRVLLSLFTVTNTADSGAGSFRQAILDSNSSAGADTINFAIGSGAATIAPTSALPEFTGPVTLDGTSQPGYSGMPLIEINGASAGQSEGLVFHGGNSTVKALVINRFYKSGVLVVDNGNNIFENNFIGTDRTGMINLGNGYHGLIASSDNNRIGGPTAAQRNLISGNGIIGLFLYQASNNIVQGNYIGTGIDGQTAIPNKSGIGSQYGAGNTFGGTASGAGNLIAGNTSDGLIILSGSNYNTIQGNLIGTDSTGTKALPNGHWGIECQGGHNLIGGTVAGARNILSGNGQDGLNFYLNTAQYNLAQGNFIGTDITGTKAIGNAYQGVSFSGDTDVDLTAPGPVNNTIGGTTPAERNIISGNPTGIGIFNRTRGNFIRGNWIGTDITGTVPLGNRTGIVLWNDASGNTIGGDIAGAGNVISNSTNDGIIIGTGCDDTTVQGNILGLDPTGTLAMPNQGNGIQSVYINRTTIGGSAPAARNIVSNSGITGITLHAGAQHLIQNNYIGTDITGTVAMPNGTAGVRINGSAISTVSGNLIANNGQQGIVLAGDGTGNRFTNNSIYNNAGLGIDLADDGVTPNAPGTRTGANNLQNYPVISSATSNAGQTTIAGTFNSTPSAAFTLEFFSSPAADPTGYGEGQTYLGSATVTTDASGNATFNVIFNVATPAGKVIAATAAASDGSTSEFSLARIVSTSASASVAGRYLFYNNSAFDGGDPLPNAADDGAIAQNPDGTLKQALLPGQTATFANYTSYSRGINGIMIDVTNLPGNGAGLTAADLALKVGNSNDPSTWAIAPAPASVTVRAGAGAGGSDRVTLLWADNLIQKQWLQITVLATGNTGLGANEVFYFGNAIGETGNNPANASVDSADELLTRANGTGLGTATIANAYDFNRDAHVNTQDQLIARANRSGLIRLKLISVPAAGPVAGATSQIFGAVPIALTPAMTTNSRSPGHTTPALPLAASTDNPDKQPPLWA